MARKTKLKADNSVKGVSSTTGNSSLAREDHVRQVSLDRHQATFLNPPSIENRNVECANNDAERKGGKCEIGNKKG